MRDPERIPVVLDALKALWEKNPDMRLGQLLLNIEQGHKLYQLEDTDLLSRINAVTWMNWEAVKVPTKLQQQIAHIEQHQAEFDDFLMEEREQSVENYFRQYGNYDELYVNLCNDLGITPKAELLPE